MDKTDFALESFKNIQDLIKYIDQKTGAVLVISGLVFTGYIEFFKRINLVISIDEITLIGVITFISSLTTIIFFVAVLYYSIFTILKPQISNNFKVDDYSLFYYEHIVALGKSKVEEDYKEIDNNKILKHILDEQYEVSIILQYKIKKFSYVLKFLFVSIISLLVFIIITLQL